MLYLLLGSNDYSKKTYINSLTKEAGADLVMFSEAEELPPVSRLIETDLFSKPKVFMLNGLPHLVAEDLLKIIASPNHIVIAQTALDKRKKENKELLANKAIVLKEFALPHGRELNDWIANRVKELGGTISSAARDSLAIALGRDEARETKIAGKVVAVEEVYNLWQAENEIQKLLAFANGKEITEAEVKALVFENGEVDVFSLTNAIADNQKQQAMELMHKFLKDQAGADEKGSIIKLNALLSEQFRNVAVVQDFMARKTSEAEILEATDWKAGRLFVMKKIAAKFQAKKVLEFLNKLEAMDAELKSSQTPPKVLLDLIVVQLLI
jgi:DNA polymerase III delta subunit